jgi:hypothetical protein
VSPPPKSKNVPRSGKTRCLSHELIIVTGSVKKPEMNCKLPSNQFHQVCINNSWMNQQGIITHVTAMRQASSSFCQSGSQILDPNHDAINFVVFLKHQWMEWMVNDFWISVLAELWVQRTRQSRHAEYPAVNLSAQTSPDTCRREPPIVYARAASQRGSYLASIVIDLCTTLYIV